MITLTFKPRFHEVSQFPLGLYENHPRWLGWEGWQGQPGSHPQVSVRLLQYVNIILLLPSQDSTYRPTLHLLMKMEDSLELFGSQFEGSHINTLGSN